MGYSATSVDIYLNKRENRERLGNFVFMHEDSRNSARGPGGEAVVAAGTRTTKENKPEMIEKLRLLLKNGQLRFHENFVSAHLDRLPSGKPNPQTQILNELRGFQREVRYKKTGKDLAYTRPVIDYRPKNGADNDDFAMASAINPYQIALFKRNPIYKTWCQRLRVF